MKVRRKGRLSCSKTVPFLPAAAASIGGGKEAAEAGAAASRAAAVKLQAEVERLEAARATAATEAEAGAAASRAAVVKLRAEVERLEAAGWELERTVGKERRRASGLELEREEAVRDLAAAEARRSDVAAELDGIRQVSVPLTCRCLFHDLSLPFP